MDQRVWLQWVTCAWRFCESAFLLCSPCNRQQYCGQECAQAAWEEGHRLAVKKYQRSDEGKKRHCEAQKRWLKENPRPSRSTRDPSGAAEMVAATPPAISPMVSQTGSLCSAVATDGDQANRLQAERGLDPCEPIAAASGTARNCPDSLVLTYLPDFQGHGGASRVETTPTAAAEAAPSSGVEEQDHARRCIHGVRIAVDPAFVEGPSRVPRCACCRRPGRILGSGREPAG